MRANSDIPIYSETDLHIAADNPLTLGLLALFQFADHPSDRFAWQHLQMTPLGEILRADAIDQAGLCGEILDDLNRHGTEFIINRWLARLLERRPELDAFSLRRADEFARAAQAFDQSGSRNLEEFLNFAENYTLREPAAEGTVQVMTIHKSKGLGFDLVLLPELAGDSLALARDGIGVQRADDRSVEWVYSLPSKDIARKDIVLNEYLEQQEADNCYESLCKFYVAMTRAKRAMYLIAPAHGSSRSTNFVQLLEATLKTDDPIPGQHHDEIVYGAGDPRWFESEAIVDPDAPMLAGEEVAQARVTDSARRARHRRLTPSASNNSRPSAARRFSPRRAPATLTRGSLIHALFEEIEWLDELGSSELEAIWDQRVPDATEEMRREVLESLPAAATIFDRPSPQASCWREKRFETLIGEDWVSGIIDRVVLDGERATIIDFKTTALDDVMPTSYQEQLGIYRSVVQKMTGLERENIRCCLFFSRAKQLIEI